MSEEVFRRWIGQGLGGQLEQDRHDHLQKLVVQHTLFKILESTVAIIIHGGMYVQD